MLIDVETACEELLKHDNILIITHKKPDGDTLGAAFALFWAVSGLGKRARVECPDKLPAKYGFLYGDYKPDESFPAGYIVSVDVASQDMLGAYNKEYGSKIDLCIDHHKSNSMYAKMTLLDSGAPAACQVIYDVLLRLGVEIGPGIANAVYTGLATDTGCFKYSNVTAKTHRAAAEMIELGARHAEINKLMFDTKSRGVLMVDRLMIDTTDFHFDGRCAIVALPADIGRKFGVDDDDLDGISSFTVRIQGVLAGVTVRARGNDTYRVSVRTVSPADASRICEKLGGGGHVNAAGCTMTGGLDRVKSVILSAVKEELERNVS